MISGRVSRPFISGGKTMSSFDIEFLGLIGFQFVLVPLVLWIATKLDERRGDQ